MDITDVKIRLLEKDKLKAVASVTFENCLVVHDIKVIESNKTLFIAMPSRKGKDGEYKDIAHPINAEMRKILSEKVLLSKNFCNNKCNINSEQVVTWLNQVNV